MSTELLNTALSYLTDILLSLSIVGSFLTVLTFMLYPKLRSYAIKLILYLCMSIIFSLFFFEISFRSSKSLFCIPSAILVHYFFLSNFFWTFSVSFNFFQMIVKRNRDTEFYEKFYHPISWGIPFIIVILCASFEKYVNRGGFPGIIIVCSNICIYFFIAKEIYKTLRHTPVQKRQTVKEFRVYFSIFVSIGSSWIFGFIYMFSDTSTVIGYTFLFLFSISTSLQGFFIFVSYCLNYKVFANYSRSFTQYGVSFFKRWENLDGETTQSGPTGTTDSSSITSTNVCAA
ncbi:hypothetical protein RB653_000469 [Dictyostelium firmibasis]|uniref:G-protein coupled receptors family 2 profile 2 domain-containing protein n=1 Tax=Dictyostelium firmibasis TaxID=79012 RepID=A0AAN7U2C9_9MYCE